MDIFDIPKCKTCKYWQKYKPETCWDDDRLKGGCCENPLLTEDTGSHSFNDKGLVYAYAEGGYFWTGPEFGCVNHLPRQGADEN